MLVMLDRRVGGLGLARIAVDVAKMLAGCAGHGVGVLERRSACPVFRVEAGNWPAWGNWRFLCSLAGRLIWERANCSAWICVENYCISLTIPARAAAAMAMPTMMVMNRISASRGMRRTAPTLIVL